LTPLSGFPQPHSRLLAGLDDELAADRVSKLSPGVGEPLIRCSPRQLSLHVMIVVVVVVVVVVVMIVVMIVMVVVVVLLGECRERREAKCGAEC
jgi:Flp pilus assembly protein TadB